MIIKYRMHWLGLSLLTLVLAGCGNGTDSVSSGPATIRGQVISDQGPVKTAAIKAVDSRNRTLATTEVGRDAHFRIQLPADTAYPVVLTATLPNGKTLEAVAGGSLVSEQNISSYTDLVVKSARQLGGLTPENIARAAGGAINQRPSQGGKRSSTGFKGDLTKQYGGWH
ncbi:MAG: hypothetical protein Kow0060_23920 [Methylohalobius crimeensis]